MKLDELIKDSIPVNVMSEIESKALIRQENVVSMYAESVLEVREMIEDPAGIIAAPPVSQGKDSLLVMLICIEAYAQSIAEGKIEPERPLIVTTVDTLVESIPMTMLVRYSVPFICNYAKSLGINFFYDVLTPPLTDEYFIRWGAGAKVLSNPSRSGDCSKILKIDVSETHIRGLRKRLNKIGACYKDAPICQFLGSRDQESARRSQNIKKSQLHINPLDDMKEIKVAGCQLHQYAPICHWSDDDVFLAHELAGSDPVTPSLLGNSQPLINSFFSHYGLLLAIYGNGSKESCSIVVGQQSGEGCNGKARFGCYVCPQVGSRDSSSEGLARYPRWRVLGAENAVAVRAYLYRLSANMGARAFHAKAVDHVGFQRIMLQPNILKPQFLEKMVWFASQLSIESQEQANHFAVLVKQGREMEHEGYRDIATDPSLTEKVRRQFLDMYKQEAQRALLTCFSERHALMLSFRWLVDGIASPTYRPMAIYQKVLDGQRLPWPMTNEKYEAKYGAISISNPLPDALALPMLTKKAEAEFDPITAPDFLSYWQRPVGTLDLFDKEKNCQIESRPVDSISVSVKMSPLVKEKTVGGESKYKVNYEHPKMQNRRMPNLAYKLIKPQLSELVKQQVLNTQSQVQQDQFEASISRGHTLKFSIPFLTMSESNYQLNDVTSGVEAYADRSERAVVRKQGKVEKTYSKMRFYKPKAVPAKYAKQLVRKERLTLSFLSQEHYIMTEDDRSQISRMEAPSLDRIYIDEYYYGVWLENGGWQRCLSIHDDVVNKALIDARWRRKQGFTHSRVRVYHGSSEAYKMLSDTGLSIKPEYREQLMKTLKRTDLFSEIGAYDYAAFSFEKLQSLPNMIPMGEHRRDKVRAVNRIRSVRNANRRLAQKGINSDTLKKDMNAFFADVHHAIDAINAGLHSGLGSFVETLTPTHRERQSASHMFLALVEAELTSFDAYRERAMTKLTNKHLEQSHQDYLQLAHAYSSSIQKVENHLTALLNDWQNKRGALKRLETRLSEDDGNHVMLWSKFLDNYDHYGQSQVTYSSIWNASVTSKLNRISNLVESIDVMMKFVEHLNTITTTAAHGAGQKALRSMNVGAKLEFLKGLV